MRTNPFNIYLENELIEIEKNQMNANDQYEIELNQMFLDADQWLMLHGKDVKIQ